MERAELIPVLRATGCAEASDGCVFLGGRKGSASFRAPAVALKSETAKPRSEIAEGWLCVPTGGTGGGLKFARHDERTLTAAVRGFCAHFGLGRVNAVDVLPAYHVSGLMARVRSAATGGEHVAWDWKRLEAGERPGLPHGRGDWVLSLVPTQLQRLLASPEAVKWLRGFAMVFVGGGPVWPEVAEAAARAELRLSLSYGMTETAAMIAALRPEEFLAGARSCGQMLPHARVRIGAEGALSVAGESVFRGYWPETRRPEAFETEDLGRIDERGHLHIFGRRDAVIITGGEKVQPAEVEAALRASGEFSEVAVVGVADPEWGQIVVACYPAEGKKPDLARATVTLTGPLRPKRFVAMTDWPRNPQGKLNRAALMAAASPDRPRGTG